MRQYEKSLRFGLSVLLCALILRLFSQGLIPKTAALLNTPPIRDFLLYLETGRAVRSSFMEETLAYAPESPPPYIPETTQPIYEETAPPETKPTIEPFRAEDLSRVEIYNTSGLSADPEALLLAPLQFSTAPEVLIYSTHSTESYTPGGESYVQTAEYRTLDDGFNMLSLGQALERELRGRGIHTVRDGTVHDYPSYNSAYSHARKTVKALLKENPAVSLVLDLHRDAADTGGQQLRTLAQREGCAQLMLVVGTDARGLVHPNWEQNLALALKLQVLLERLSPGITRPICLRPQRFNQDLAPGSLIVEIGGAGNTRAEALEAVPVLAEAIGALLTMEGEWG